MTACASCLWEKENNSLIDGSRTNVGWSRLIGISEASIRRHKAHSEVFQQSSSFVDETGDRLLESIDVPAEFVTSRGMSLRDPVSGSWQKVTWQPNRKALHDSLSYDDLAASLEGWNPPEVETFTDTERVAILNMSDLQIGKASQRGGGTPETLASVKRSVQRFIAYIRAEGITTVVLVDGGDPIENVFNVPSQLVTNDLPVTAQIRTFRKMMIEVIKAVAPYVIRIVYVSVPSNHGALRTGYKSPGGTTDADFGLDLNEQIEDAVRENPHLGHVEFVRPEALFETATLEIGNTKLAFNHGHQSGGVFGHGKWWASQDHGRMPGWDADILVTAHFHTQATYQSGDGRWVVACASSDPGSDWYTNKAGESALRGMTAFDVLDGQPINVRII